MCLSVPVCLSLCRKIVAIFIFNWSKMLSYMPGLTPSLTETTSAEVSQGVPRFKSKPKPELRVGGNHGNVSALGIPGETWGRAFGFLRERYEIQSYLENVNAGYLWIVVTLYTLKDKHFKNWIFWKESQWLGLHTLSLGFTVVSERSSMLPGALCEAVSISGTAHSAGEGWEAEPGWARVMQGMVRG